MLVFEGAIFTSLFFNRVNQDRAIAVAKGGGEAGGLASPIEILPIIKMSQKRLLFLQFQFLLASSRATVHVYNSNKQ